MKFENLKRELLHSIQSDYSQGDRFLPQRKISALYKISLNTVDRALRELEEEGWLIRRHGSGTYVSRPEPGQPKDQRIAMVMMYNVGLTPRFFFYPIAMSMLHQLSQDGYAVSFFHAEEFDTTKSLLRQLNRRGNDFAGYVLLGDTCDEWCAELQLAGRAFVVVDHVPDVPGVCYVTSDNEEGICAAVDFLVQNGHREIGFASVLLRSNLLLRYECFCSAMAEHGLPVNRQHVIRHWDEAATPEQLKQMFQGSKPPTAFVCANDCAAGYLIRALEPLGISVPGDVSVIGYDGEPVNEIVPAGLTSLEVDREEIGRQAARVIHQAIAGETPAPVNLPVKLLVKQTVRNIATADGNS